MGRGRPGGLFRRRLAGTDERRLAPSADPAPLPSEAGPRSKPLQRIGRRCRWFQRKGRLHDTPSDVRRGGRHRFVVPGSRPRHRRRSRLQPGIESRKPRCPRRLRRATRRSGRGRRSRRSGRIARPCPAPVPGDAAAGDSSARSSGRFTEDGSGTDGKEGRGVARENAAPANRLAGRLVCAGRIPALRLRALRAASVRASAPLPPERAATAVRSGGHPRRADGRPDLSRTMLPADREPRPLRSSARPPRARPALRLVLSRPLTRPSRIRVGTRLRPLPHSPRAATLPAL